jgi:hypothetical protein
MRPSTGLNQISASTVKTANYLSRLSSVSFRPFSNKIKLIIKFSIYSFPDRIERSSIRCGLKDKTCTPANSNNTCLDKLHEIIRKL